MGIMGATYRGVHSDEFGIAVRTNPMILPEHENTLVKIPGMHGAHDNGSVYGVGKIQLEITIIEKDIYSYSEKLRMLANWLRPDEGVGEYVADHEPDKTYYAKLENVSNSRIERIARAGEGTIELICPDPFAYGEERTYNISTSSVNIPNEGTTDTYPVFDLTVMEDTSFIYIKNANNMDEKGNEHGVYLGEEEDAGSEPIETRKLVLHDTMQSTSSWTGAGEVDSGRVTGQFSTDKNGFFVDDWGDSEDGSRDWIGPSLVKSLPNQLNSFRVDIKIENMNYLDLNGNKVSPKAIGIIEVYVRDINDRLICKIALGDSFSNANWNYGLFAGDGKRYRLKDKGWNNNFDGILRIVRDSYMFEPYIAMIDKNGRHVNVDYIKSIQIGDSVSENPAAKIQVAMRKMDGAVRMYQRIKEIKVYDIVGAYEYPDNGTPIEFKKGDNLVIDTRAGKVFLNGEENNNLIHVGTDFFTLVEGLNELETSGNIEGTVTFPERFL